MLIGELSRRSGVNPHQLRYYESQGLLEPRRGGNGYREYDDAAVRVVAEIRNLLDAGLSTQEIRRLLPCATGEVVDPALCAEYMEVLRTRLDRTEEAIASLARSRAALLERIDVSERYAL